MKRMARAGGIQTVLIRFKLLLPIISPIPEKERLAMVLFEDENTLHRFFGDSHFLRELRREFVETVVPEYRARLKDALVSEDTARITEVAHSFKNMCGTIGAMRAHELAMKIEQVSRLNYPDMALEAFVDLERELDFIIAFFLQPR